MFREIIFAVMACAILATAASGWGIWTNVSDLLAATQRLRLVAWLRVARSSIHFTFGLTLVAWTAVHLGGGPRDLVLVFLFITFFDYPVGILLFEVFERWVRQKLRQV